MILDFGGRSQPVIIGRRLNGILARDRQSKLPVSVPGFNRAILSDTTRRRVVVFMQLPQR
jgi:hypothetical protein